MLELGGSQTPDQTPAAAGELIKDGTEATFMADVIEGSRETPVIVDFWATWCGPCKTLTPMLEAAVTAAKGKVRLIKIDVDKEQRLAGALAQQGLPLQSIPTVVAFFGGQPVDMFQGAIPQSQLNEFVTKLAAMAGDGGLGEAIEAAEEMLAEGAVADAAQTFAAILGEEPENAAAMAGLARAHIAMEQLDQAEALLNNAPEVIANAPEIEAVRAQIELARQAADAGPLGELSAAVEADPANHQARFDYALALHAAGQVEEAVEQLLELFRRDREWNDAAAKTQLFTIFDALKPTDPIAQKGRRRLSSMIFA
jgi:putative thioredoxin